MSRGTFYMKNNASENTWMIFISDNARQISGFLAELFQQGFQNCTLRGRGTLRSKIFVSRKKFVSVNLCGYAREIFGFLTTTVQHGCQNCTQMPKQGNGNVWGKRMFAKKCLKNRNSSKFVPDFRRESLAVLSKMHSRNTEKLFWGKYFSMKVVVFERFRTLSKKFSEFWPKVLGTFLRIALKCPEKPLHGK